MTRDEAIKLLQGGPGGVRKWNRRREAGEAIPDLTGAKLSRPRLGGGKLSRANLSGAPV